MSGLHTLFRNKLSCLILATGFVIGLAACGEAKQPIEPDTLPDYQVEQREADDVPVVQPDVPQWDISIQVYELWKRKGMEDGEGVQGHNPFIDPSDTTVPPSKKSVSIDGQERELPYIMSAEGYAFLYWVYNADLRLYDFYEDKDGCSAGYIHGTDELRYLKYPSHSTDESAVDKLGEEACMAKAFDAAKTIINTADYEITCERVIYQKEVPTHYVFRFGKNLGGIRTSDYVEICVSTSGELQELWIGDIGMFDDCKTPIPSEDIVNEAIKDWLQKELEEGLEIKDYRSDLLIIQTDNDKVLILAKVHGMTNGNFPRYASATIGVECKKIGY